MQERGVQASGIALPMCHSPDLQGFRAGFIHPLCSFSPWPPAAGAKNESK